MYIQCNVVTYTYKNVHRQTDRETDTQIDRQTHIFHTYQNSLSILLHISIMLQTH